jgi:transducin (beta)-like 1
MFFLFDNIIIMHYNVIDVMFLSARQKMCMTSDEINYLVYRYLQESGFEHTAFVFNLESHTNSCNIDGTLVPPGALISILQKGLQFVQAEISLSDDGLIATDSDSLSLIEAVIPDIYGISSRTMTNAAPKSYEIDNNENDIPHVKFEDPDVTMMLDTAEEQPAFENGTSAPSENFPAEDHDEDTKENVFINKDNIRHFPHDKEVFSCVWNPVTDKLATGSGDSTIRIWDMVDTSKEPIVLKHATCSGNDKKLDITALDWSPNGEFLASGCLNGSTKIFKNTGELLHTFKIHGAPIFALKFNCKGQYLVTGGMSPSVVVIDLQTAQQFQDYKFNPGNLMEATMDIHWQNEKTFAACSNNTVIYVCRLGLEKPIKYFKGHEREVNVLRWDRSGTYLASGSEDRTARIWSLKSEECLHTLQGHLGSVEVVRWMPPKHKEQKFTLATASQDSTVRLWNAKTGDCLQNYNRHTCAVLSICFSPCGRFLASGSVDRTFKIWGVKDGMLVNNYQGGGVISDVCWNSTGNKIAASSEDTNVIMIELTSESGS